MHKQFNVITDDVRREMEDMYGELSITLHGTVRSNTLNAF